MKIKYSNLNNIHLKNACKKIMESTLTQPQLIHKIYNICNFISQTMEIINHEYHTLIQQYAKCDENKKPILTNNMLTFDNEENKKMFDKKFNELMNLEAELPFEQFQLTPKEMKKLLNETKLTTQESYALITLITPKQ